MSTVSDRPTRRAPRTGILAATIAAEAHWHTYKYLLAQMISVSQLAMINSDIADYWAEIYDFQPHSSPKWCDVPKPTATARTMIPS